MVNFNDLIDINRLKTFLNEIKSKFAAATHTHTKSDITDFPSSLKNPSSLTLTKNGTSYSYDGSSGASLGAIYTPTTAGTAGYVPVSQGSGAPLWKMPDNYAVCSTAAGTVAKTAAISNFKLVTGVMVTIKFTYAHTAATAATLNVNSTGAKTIYYYHGNQATKDYAWEAGETVVFQYDGSYWRAVASDRFAKKFAALEEKIEGLGGSVSGIIDIPAVSLPKNGTTTVTLTITDLTKEYTHGYFLIKKSTGEKVGITVLPWNHLDGDIYFVDTTGTWHVVYTTVSLSYIKTSMSAKQSGSTMTITLEMRATSADSFSAGDYKVHYELF